MLQLGTTTVIEGIYHRIKKISHLSDLVIATSDTGKDDAFVNFCKEKQLNVFRGSENDVLARYYEAAMQYEADLVIRITGDCPLIDPQECEKVIDRLLSTGADYVSNVDPPTYPDGYDTEVFTFAALKKAYEMTNKASDREHVTLFIRENPDIFQTDNVALTEDFSHLRLTLDESDDYKLLQNIFGYLEQNQCFGNLREVVTLLQENPELSSVNSHICRNEGLEKSIQNDQVKQK